MGAIMQALVLLNSIPINQQNIKIPTATAKAATEDLTMHIFKKPQP